MGGGLAKCQHYISLCGKLVDVSEGGRGKKPQNPVNIDCEWPLSQQTYF